MTVYIVTCVGHRGLEIRRSEPDDNDHVWATLDAPLPHDHYTSSDDARSDRVLLATLVFRVVREAHNLDRGDEVIW